MQEQATAGPSTSLLAKYASNLPFEDSLFVLPDASLYITRHPDIKVMAPAGHNVGVIHMLSHRASISATYQRHLTQAHQTPTKSQAHPKLCHPERRAERESKDLRLLLPLSLPLELQPLMYDWKFNDQLFELQMDKQQILSEIRRTATANGGEPLGRLRFFNETGIKESDWLGKWWPRWSAVVEEAGFTPLTRQGKNDRTKLSAKSLNWLKD